MPFDRAFSEEFAICWYLYRCRRTGACRVTDYLDLRPEHPRAKVLGKMRAWASQGSWDIRVEFVKRLELAASVTDVVLYEVKSHQDRILFIRHKWDAIAVDATLKKNDWSKKDQHFLDAAIEVAREALAELGGGKRR